MTVIMPMSDSSTLWKPVDLKLPSHLYHRYLALEALNRTHQSMMAVVERGGFDGYGSLEGIVEFYAQQLGLRGLWTPGLIEPHNEFDWEILTDFSRGSPSQIGYYHGEFLEAMALDYPARLEVRRHGHETFEVNFPWDREPDFNQAYDDEVVIEGVSYVCGMHYWPETFLLIEAEGD